MYETRTTVKNKQQNIVWYKNVKISVLIFRIVTHIVFQKRFIRIF